MKHLFLLVLVALVFFISACTINENDQENDESELISLTLVELAYYDGLEGRPAYIAVQGNIYDVTHSVHWPNGRHNGYQAGQDLTNMILNVSPHGLSTLDNVPLIGMLIDDEEDNA